MNLATPQLLADFVRGEQLCLRGGAVTVEGHMTETAWLDCARTGPMLAFLDGKASDRKLRLFGCGNFRRIWAQATDPRARAAVEVAELFADGLANPARLAQAKRSVQRAARRAHFATRAAAALTHQDPPKPATGLAGRGLFYQVGVVACGYIRSLAGANHTHLPRMEQRLAYEDGLQAVLLREIIGNPFRPVPVHPSWLSTDVRNLAHAAYEERMTPSGELDPLRLAVLADALEDAGADEAMRTHLRAPGVHPRGCWCVDLLLGRS